MTTVHTKRATIPKNIEPINGRDVIFGRLQNVTLIAATQSARAPTAPRRCHVCQSPDVVGHPRLGHLPLRHPHHVRRRRHRLLQKEAKGERHEGSVKKA